MFKLCVLLIITYITTTSALPPCVCTRNYVPVCGSDDVTYANECLLNCENSRRRNAEISIKKQGSCEADTPALPQVCICPQNYSPVCGNDGQTYSNECELNCQKKTNPDLERKATGECPKDDVKGREARQVKERPLCFCTFEYNPICGNDGQTYSNQCEFTCQKNATPDLEVRATGECSNDNVRVARQVTPDDNPAANIMCICPAIYAPVCHDGELYANSCLTSCPDNSEKRQSC